MHETLFRRELKEQTSKSNKIYLKNYDGRSCSIFFEKTPNNKIIIAVVANESKRLIINLEINLNE